MRKGKTGRVERLLRGVAEIRITGAAPWELVNACIRERITIEGVESDDLITCRALIFAADAERVKSLAPRCGCDVEVLSVRGRRVWKNFLHRRRWAALCAAVIVAALLISSLFVWDIRVTENDSDIPDAVILRTLAGQGVGVGSFWPGFRGERIRSRALAELPGLCWLAVNVRGSTASVEVRAAVEKPEITDPRQAADITASRSGVITDIRVFEGDTLVSRGDAVTTGQTLVSAERAARHGETRTVHARAEITAHTWYELTASAPLMAKEKERAGAARYRFALILSDLRINFYADSGISGMECDKITKIWRLGIDGVFSLPVAVAFDTLRPYALTEEPLSHAAVRAALEEALRAVLQERIGETGKVISEYFTESEENGMLTLTLRCECEERIDEETLRP